MAIFNSYVKLPEGIIAYILIEQMVILWREMWIMGLPVYILSKKLYTI